MAEEIEWLDEELANITLELGEKIKEITSAAGKKLGKSAREDRFAFINDRVARAKDVLSSYKVELRQVLKEVGKGTWAEYEAKGKEHNANINKLAAEAEAAKKAAETRELMENAKKKKKKKGEPDVENPGDEILEEAKRVQLKSATALAKSSALVAEMEAMGGDQNQQLAVQTEQIKSTHSDVDAINEGMNRASKQVRDITRRLATDKMIMCMVLVLFLMIIFLIVSQFLGWNPAKGLMTVDCTLDYNKRTKQCIEQQMALDQLLEEGAYAGSEGGGDGGGGGQGGAAGNSTRRDFIETAAPFAWKYAPHHLASLEDDLEEVQLERGRQDVGDAQGPGASGRERDAGGAHVGGVDDHASEGAASATWGKQESVRAAMAATRQSAMLGRSWGAGSRRHGASDQRAGSVETDGRTATKDGVRRR